MSKKPQSKGLPSPPAGFWPGLMPASTTKRARAVAKAFRAGKIEEARRLAKEKS